MSGCSCLGMSRQRSWSSHLSFLLLGVDETKHETGMARRRHPGSTFILTGIPLQKTLIMTGETAPFEGSIAAEKGRVSCHLQWWRWQGRQIAIKGLCISTRKKMTKTNDILILCGRRCSFSFQVMRWDKCGYYIHLYNSPQNGREFCCSWLLHESEEAQA